MTNDERRKAFDLRLRGKTWNDIAKALNYSEGASVERDIRRCVSGRRKGYRCVYPALREFINSEYYGSVPEFANSCGVSYSTMYALLTGKHRPTVKTTQKICEKAGLTYDEAFGGVCR